MNTLPMLGVALASALTGATFAGTPPPSGHAARDEYEVWLVDQSNTNGTTFGGAIHVFAGDDLTRGRNDESVSPVATIDLAGATAGLCLAETGANPVRPHMLVFNSTDTHAVLTFVASGHVVIYDARAREPLACFRTEVGAGGARQAHAAWPTSDDRYLVIANQNGKKLERIRTDYRRERFAQEPTATLDLATCTTPTGMPCQAPELRPDNAPICPFVASNNGPAFVSLRGGGLFVVDWRSEPMRIVGEYDMQHVPANGCGFIEARGWVFGNGGGGTPANLDQFSVYRLPMKGFSPWNPANYPSTQLLFDDPAHERDAHGVAVTRHERFVWVGDRDANVVEVFEARTGARVSTLDLVSAYSKDPTPDLFASSPDHRWLFVSTRGPNPLTGDPHSSLGTDPGMLVIRVHDSGMDGEIRRLVRISNRDAGGIERADPHGIRLRQTSCRKGRCD
jgi:hypothetical protein